MKYKSKKKEIISVDKKTGKEIDGVIVICNLKRNPYTKGWIMKSQEALELLATDKDLTGETYKVLLYLLSILDFDNWINIPQKQISEKLEIRRQHIGRAIKLLERKKILLRGPKLGRSYSFRLNPYYGWKGKVINLEDYREEIEENRIKNLKNKNDKNRNQKIQALSKKYDIPICELKEYLE